MKKTELFGKCWLPLVISLPFGVFFVVTCLFGPARGRPGWTFQLSVRVISATRNVYRHIRREADGKWSASKVVDAPISAKALVGLGTVAWLWPYNRAFKAFEDRATEAA